MKRKEARRRMVLNCARSLREAAESQGEAVAALAGLLDEISGTGEIDVWGDLPGKHFVGNGESLRGFDAAVDRHSGDGEFSVFSQIDPFTVREVRVDSEGRTLARRDHPGEILPKSEFSEWGARNCKCQD